MNKIINKLVIGFILIVLYLILRSSIVDIIGSFAVIFSPDGILEASTILRIYYWGIVDILIVFLYICARKNKYHKIMAFSFIFILLVQCINILDRRLCWQESFSLNYLTAFILILVSIITILVALKQNKKIFWWAASIVFIVAAADELFGFHEYLGKVVSSHLNFGSISFPSNTITALYFVLGFVVLLFLYFKEKNRDALFWIFIVLGLSMHGSAVIIESIVEICAEEYLETVASFLYFLGVWVYHENRNISS